MSRAAVARAKRLSWLLRHGAGTQGVPMDPAGWVEVDAVLGALGLTRAELDETVATNDKGRLQLDGDRVRACQGHSREGMPVTLELTRHVPAKSIVGVRAATRGGQAALTNARTALEL